MLRFTSDQIQTMNDQAMDDMAELWARIIGEVYVNETAHLSNDQLLSNCRDRVVEARYHGLEDGEDIGLYVQAGILFGSRFPEQMPELGFILVNDIIPFEDREDALSRYQAGVGA